MPKKTAPVSLTDQFARTKPNDTGIIGDPVEHSLSPAMHNAAFHSWWSEKKHLDAAPVYHRFHVRPEQLGETVALMRQRELRGLNVTVPHKASVLRYVDKVDSHAKRVEAVNTLSLGPDGLRGYNTDAEGFQMSLERDLEFDPSGKTALILGAGATGRVIAYTLFDLGARQVFVWNRNPQRVMGVVQENGAPHPDLMSLRTAADAIARAGDMDLIVNATSVGLSAADGLPVEGLRFKKGQAAFDVVYHRDTAFMKSARAAGAEVTGGFGMLLYQGAKSFEIWTGDAAPLEVMRGALMQSLKDF